MPHQQQSTIVSVLSTVLVYSIYFVILGRLRTDGAFEGADAASFAAKAILWLIGASILANIVLQIGFSILIAIIRRNPKLSLIVDERDKMIELRGLQVSAFVTGVGFILSLLALYQDMAVWIALNMIMLGFALGDVAGNLFRLYLYRRGF